MGENLSFPVAWGVEREIGHQLGAFWHEANNFMQPTEFLINKKGRILASTYSSSPIGRMDPAEALVLTKFLASRK